MTTIGAFPKVRIRTIILLVAILATVPLLVAACGSTTTSTTASTSPAATGTTAAGGGASTVQVTMKNIAFNPQTVTIKVGDTVTWTNEDSPQHDVTADNGDFKSDLLSQGQSFSFTFTKAGTFTYKCTVHPNMTGTVIVQ